MRRAMLVAAFLSCLSACSDDGGNGPEDWLEQYSRASGEWDRVARVFGFFDDDEGCQTIVKALAARYRCERVKRSR